jgi:hypothetical protein
MPPADADLPILWRLWPAPALPHLAALVTFAAEVRGLAAGTALPAAGRVRALADLDRLIAAPDGAAASLLFASPTAPRLTDACRELARSLAATGTPPRHLRHFLQACRREAEGWSPESWSDVVVHGRFAAASLGRHALALAWCAAGNSADRGTTDPEATDRAATDPEATDRAATDRAAAGRALDALAIAIWLLRQLRAIDPTPPSGPPPLAIPARFFADAMITPGHLRLATARGQVRAVLDRVLDGVDHLIDDAAPLARHLPTAGLARHAVILRCRASRLAAALRHGDPLVQPVHLGAWARGRCAVSGFLYRHPG